MSPRRRLTMGGPPPSAHPALRRRSRSQDSQDPNAAANPTAPHGPGKSKHHSPEKKPNHLVGFGRQVKAKVFWGPKCGRSNLSGKEGETGFCWGDTQRKAAAKKKTLSDLKTAMRPRTPATKKKAKKRSNVCERRRRPIPPFLFF